MKYVLMSSEHEQIGEWSTTWELTYGDSVTVNGVRYFIAGYDPVTSQVFLSEIN